VEVDPLAPQPKKGFLARLLGSSRRPLVTKTVHRKEQLNLTVPAGHADAVRAAVERWLEGHGVGATVTTEDAGEGKTRLRASLGEDDAAKIDFTDDRVQSELQDLLSDAVR
jgi:hypothetical protein